MCPEDGKRLDVWRREMLAAVTVEVSAGCGGLDMAGFNAFITALGRQASAGFMQAFGLATKAGLDRMDLELKSAYALEIASALNAGLPLDYPFIVVLAFSDQSPQFRMCVLLRKIIPGAHDLVTRGIIPILCIKNALIGSETGLNLQGVEIEYFTPGDNLEEVFKL